MIPRLLALTDIDMDFVKFLLIGMATGIVALAIFVAYLVKRTLEIFPVVTAALSRAADTMQEMGEVISESQRQRDRCATILAEHTRRAK